jgi:uncharacterized protein (TIGR03084 family)
VNGVVDRIQTADLLRAKALSTVIDDLAAEGSLLESAVAGFDEEQRNSLSGAAGWTVLDQLAHLAWTDEVAVLALTRDPLLEQLVSDAQLAPDDFADRHAHAVSALGWDHVLSRWRASRALVIKLLKAEDPRAEVPWFGPPMAPASMASARLMETWAHGLDIADGLGLMVAPTSRLRHIVHLGVRTRNYAFRLHGLAVPPQEFRVELTAPDSELWAYGPESAPDQIVGSAMDFCLLVTRRRHPSDLELTVTGDQAQAWLPIAQAFAGSPGQSRARITRSDAEV